MAKAIVSKKSVPATPETPVTPQAPKLPPDLRFTERLGGIADHLDDLGDLLYECADRGPTDDRYEVMQAISGLLGYHAKMIRFYGCYNELEAKAAEEGGEV
jgi:hypothetical protein